MRRWIHERALAIVLLALFVAALVGQFVTGWMDYI
jgi:hypothetical protein